MVKEGFDKVDKKFVKVDGRFNKVDENFKEVNMKLHDIGESVSQHTTRIERLEENAGILQ